MKSSKRRPRRKSSPSWVKVVFTGLLEKLFGPTRGLSLKTVLATLLSYVVIIAVLPTGWKLVIEVVRERNVHSLQDKVSAIELRLNSPLVTTDLPKASGFRELLSFDVTTHEKVCADEWKDGRLSYRTYFTRGQILARDIFIYKGDMLSAKRREYFDDGAKVMIEEFSQTGLLLTKRHFEKHDPGNYRDYMRDFRSPLPPAAYAFYR